MKNYFSSRAANSRKNIYLYILLKAYIVIIQCTYVCDFQFFSYRKCMWKKKHIFLYRYILYRANEKLDAKKRESEKNHKNEQKSFVGSGFVYIFKI